MKITIIILIFIFLIFIIYNKIKCYNIKKEDDYINEEIEKDEYKKFKQECYENYRDEITTKIWGSEIVYMSGPCMCSSFKEAEMYAEIWAYADTRRKILGEIK